MTHKKTKSSKESRSPVVAGQFYPADSPDLNDRVQSYLEESDGEIRKAIGAVVPHAGYDYSGFCAAHVFARLELPPTVVILAPNHTGICHSPGGVSLWASGAFETPLGPVTIARDFARVLEKRSRLVADDHSAHRREHAIEVELPFIEILAPDSEIVPLVLARDDWNSCRELAGDLVKLIREWPTEVLLLASSDMTHFEPADSAAKKDRLALAAVEDLDGEKLLEVCRNENITMCGRAPVAVVLEASRQLGATRADLVDYRHSGLVTGNDDNVVTYAGVLIE